MSSAAEIILHYVCPSLGCLMASIMFAAPVQDLRQALMEGSLGALNPFPWIFMTGNCLGWVVYGYYTHDPFVLAANLPGLVLSLWLNSGAARLQYLELCDKKKDPAVPSATDLNSIHATEDPPTAAQEEDEEVDDERQGILSSSSYYDASSSEAANELLVMVPQERKLLRMLMAWSIVIVWVGWFSSYNPATIVGVIVNINLIFFYGAPLQTMQTVIRTKTSESIHVPTMVMNWCNTSFWIAYGLAQWDFVIILPNAIGLLLGVMQGVLCLFYPRGAASNPVADNEPEVHVPSTSPPDGEVI